MNTQWWKRACALAMIAIGTWMPLAAHAGRNCEATAPDAAKTQKGIRFATQVRESLELSGANLVLIGRVGSDQSKRGVRMTHVGYLFRDHPAGQWTVVHELNGCGSGESDLFDEGLANFFMDDPFDYEAQIVIPSPELQEKLAKVLLSPVKRSMHHPSYSSIANPWSTKHQNSNGWVLEVFAAALAGPEAIRNRADAQRWLKESAYQPALIRIGAGERAGARLFTPNIRFGDHPDSAWQNQTYEVSTGDAVLAFARKADPTARLITQRLDGRPVIAQKTAAESPAPAARPVEATAAQRATPAPIAASTVVAAPAAAPQSRAQLLQSMQGLIVPYACRPQGYLSQCRQIERGNCAKQVSDAVLRCFATVSDQQLMSGSEQAAMQQMQEVGYCAVEAVDASYAALGKRATTAQGQACPGVRNFK